MKKMSVLLTTEGTYPHQAGGVSTWCHKLISDLNKIDYSLMCIVDSPMAAYKFELPSNVKALITIPLWGTMEPSEHLSWRTFSSIFLSKIKTTETVIKEDFIPIFSDVIEDILRIQKNPKKFGENLLKMYNYFRIYDYGDTMKSNFVYMFYKEKILQNLESDSYFFNKDKIVPTIYELEQSLGWFFRFFNVINTCVPKTDITHSSAAGFCGIPCVIAKQCYGSRFLLTEHGVYIREQYLSADRRKMLPFLKNFFVSLTESIVRLNYEYADLICPVCDYNARWEKEFGVAPDKIQVIYNGVSSKAFNVDSSESNNQRIVAVARIDRLKDIKNFIQAAKYILDAVPQTSFAVYGGESDEEYYKECVKLRNSLGLKEKFIFHGHVNDLEKAYHDGAIVVLPSISEGFPFSIVEAMMCGKAIVATDVGGVSEALKTAGIIVVPGDSKELADACISLIKDPDLRKRLGIKARQRAEIYFSMERFTELYLGAYDEVLGPS